MTRVEIGAHSVERLLLVCLDNLGDLVFTASLAPHLKAHFTAARIVLWCKEYAADVARLVPGVDEVVACDPFWDRAPGRAKGSFLRFAGTVRALRRQHFDLAVITSSQWRASAAVRFTGARVRVGLERHRNRSFLTHTLPPANVKLPVLVELARLLDALAVPHPPLRYALDAARVEDERARIARSIASPFTVLHAFASKRDRCVRLEEWIAVAKTLESRGETIVWVGSPAELREARSHAETPRYSRFADEFTNGTLRETIALLSCARLFVGHDSGPLHVANAFGVPVVGIFAPGQPLRTFPQGTGPSRVLHAPTPDRIDAALMLREIDALAAEAGARA